MPSAIATATGSLTAPCAAMQRRRHAEQRRSWRRCCRRRRRARDVGGAARHVRQPRHQEAAGARLGGRDRQPRVAQQGADDLLHRPAVGAEDVRAERGGQLVARALERRARRAPRASRARVRCSSICPIAARIVVEIGGVALGPARVDRLHGFFDVRLAAAGDERASSGRRARRRRARASGPAHSASNIGCSSRGGPGSRTRSTLRRRARSTARARCRWGCRARCAPRGTCAWRRLTSGIGRPRRCEARLDLRDDRSSIVHRQAERPPATTSRVRSSSVGPRPPVRMTRSARVSACRSTSRDRARSSPTTLLARSSMPSAASRPARNSELVSMRVEPSSSLPTAMISAVRGGRRLSESMRAAATSAAAATRFA